MEVVLGHLGVYVTLDERVDEIDLLEVIRVLLVEQDVANDDGLLTTLFEVDDPGTPIHSFKIIRISVINEREIGQIGSLGKSGLHKERNVPK